MRSRLYALFVRQKVRTAKHDNGFSLVEVLVALAISGLLLAAVAVAFNASVMNYQENENIFKTVNNARQALVRMTSQLRTAGYEVAPDFWVAADPCAPSNECSFFTAGGDNITYQYRSADNKLYLITNSDGQEYVLCENVVAMNFIKTPTDAGDDCKSVQISMTVQSGNVQRTLAAAAVVRRNLPL